MRALKSVPLSPTREGTLHAHASAVTQTPTWGLVPRTHCWTRGNYKGNGDPGLKECGAVIYGMSALIVQIWLLKISNTLLRNDLTSLNSTPGTNKAYGKININH